MTIHKAQGATLPYVEVNCDSIFAPGQLAVAIGRAKSVSGLAVFNFNEHKHIIQPRKDVSTFMSRNSVSLNPNDNECCLHLVKMPTDPPADVLVADVTLAEDILDDEHDREIVHMLAELFDDQIPESEFDSLPIEQVIEGHNALHRDDNDIEDEQGTLQETEIQEQSQQNKQAAVAMDESQIQEAEIDEAEPVNLSQEDIEKLNIEFGNLPSIQCLKHADPMNSIQNEWNRYVDILAEWKDIEKVPLVFAFKLNAMWIKCVKKKVTSPAYTNFYSMVHMFCANNLKEVVQKILGVDDLNSTNVKLLTSWLVLVRKHIISIKETSTEKPMSTKQTVLQNVDISVSAKSKVRYLAGRSVAKTKKNVVASVRRNIGKKSGVDKVNKGQKMIRYLEHMRTSFEHASKGKLSETLVEIERKQNNIGGLTHVTDDVFLFYEELKRQRRKLHTIQRLSLLGENIFPDTQQELHANQTVHDSYIAIFEGKTEYEIGVVNELKFTMLDAYIVVANNEFRKFASQALGKRKVFHLRHEIFRGGDSNKKQKATSSAKVNETVKESDKPGPSEENKIPEEKSAIKCKNTTAEKRNKKKKSENLDKNETEQVPEDPKNDIAQPETDPGMDNETEPEVRCPKCNAIFPDRKQWIGCDSCDSWYHRTCASIKKVQWDRLKKTDEGWICPQCDTA